MGFLKTNTSHGRDQWELEKLSRATNRSGAGGEVVMLQSGASD